MNVKIKSKEGGVTYLDRGLLPSVEGLEIRERWASVVCRIKETRQGEGEEEGRGGEGRGGRGEGESGGEVERRERRIYSERTTRGRETLPCMTP